MLPTGPNRDLRFIEAALTEARGVCEQFEFGRFTQKIIGVGRVHRYQLPSASRSSPGGNWVDQGTRLLVLSARGDDLVLLITSSITHEPKSADVAEGGRREGQVEKVDKYADSDDSAGTSEPEVVPLSPALKFRRVAAAASGLNLDDCTDFVFTLTMGTELRLAVEFDCVENMPVEVFEILIWLVLCKKGKRTDVQLGSERAIGFDVENAGEVRRRMARDVGSFAAQPVDEATTAFAALSVRSPG